MPAASLSPQLYKLLHKPEEVNNPYYSYNVIPVHHRDRVDIFPQYDTDRLFQVIININTEFFKGGTLNP